MVSASSETLSLLLNITLCAPAYDLVHSFPLSEGLRHHMDFSIASQAPGVVTLAD